MSSITTEGCRASVGGWTVQRAALLLIFLALLVLWSPAAAKIIVEPGPAELPTDGINVDGEWFVPVWQAYSPLEFLTIVLLIHCPLLAVPFEIICSAGVLAFLGYWSSRHPLDNKKRSRIYACIRDHPGIAPMEIARITERSTAGRPATTSPASGRPVWSVSYIGAAGWATSEAATMTRQRRSYTCTSETIFADRSLVSSSKNPASPSRK